MRVFVHAIVLGAGTVPVAEVVGDIALGPVAHFRQGGIDARFARVAFRRKGYIGGRLRQVDTAFGIPDDLRRFERGRRHQQCLRIGIAHVLRRVDEHSARDVFGVLSPIDHAGKPIQRRVGIRAAHGLDERGYDVVMHILVLVVRQCAMRRSAFHLRLRDDGRVLARAWLLHARRKLEGGKRRTAVAARQKHDGAASSRVERIQAIKPARIDHGPVDQLCHIAVGEPLETDHARAADKSGVHLEKRVLGGGAHQHHGAVLHRMEKRVLLATVESMDLVHEQYGARAVKRQALLGGIDFPAQVGYGTADGRHLNERGLGGFGDDVSDGGFAGSRRAVEDDRADVVLLDGRA